MSKNVDAIRGKMDAHSKAMREIADRALAEARDFTKDEREEVQRHLAKIELLEDDLIKADPQRRREREKKDAQEFWAAVEEQLPGLMGLDFGATGGTRKSARPAGAWSKAFTAAMGAKALITPSGSIGAPSLSDTIPTSGERLQTVLAAIPMTTTDAASVKYIREVTRTQNAAPVAAGAPKPVSVYELAEIDAPIEVVAHLSEPIPRQWLSDAANLSRYLDDVLRQGLQLAWENQALNGNGISPQLAGLLTVNDHVVLPPTPGDDLLAIARRGVTVLEAQSLPANDGVYVINPGVWEALELLEATGSGVYKMGDSAPINRQRRQLWGVPVALSIAMPTDAILLFHRTAVELFEREGTVIDWHEGMTAIDETPTSLFAHNLVQFRAELRAALAIYRPGAVIEILLDAGS